MKRSGYILFWSRKCLGKDYSAEGGSGFGDFDYLYFGDCDEQDNVLAGVFHLKSKHCRKN
jgi:hypothetical protein